MKDKKLPFDRKCHVLYSRPCKKEIRAKIALHYPAVEREAVWEKVQRQYADFLSDRAEEQYPIRDRRVRRIRRLWRVCQAGAR